MIGERLKQYQTMLEKKLESYLPEEGTQQADVAEAMRYSLLDGGKRIRPVLLMEFCRVCGGDPEKVLPFACAVEMIHTYSLIHDDLPCMDDDSMRRGRPSNHIMFGEASALLAGDALLTMAFEIMSSKEAVEAVGAERAVRASHILAFRAGASGMIGGQQIDLMSEGRGISLDTLRTMDEKKTSALISAACRMGCALAGAGEEKEEAAGRYAWSMGLAFQIVDDILDATGTQEELGKPVHSDAERDKNTYVSFMGLTEASEEAQRLTQEAVKQLDAFGEEAAFLKELTNELCSRRK